MAKERYDRQTPEPQHPSVWGAKCSVCPLNGSRPVFGDGSRTATFAFIGEAPGRDEVAAGLPFIGKSGEALEGYLKKIGLERSEVWIDNAICCFPPGGDLKAYLQGYKKQAKQAGVKFYHPVDCCHARLFTALKVPKCRKCGDYQWGPNDKMCKCPNPSFFVVDPWAGGERKSKTAAATTHPQYVMNLGNFAMLATLGYEGITAHQGYREDMVERREKLIRERHQAAREKAHGP